MGLLAFLFSPRNRSLSARHWQGITTVTLPASPQFGQFSDAEPCTPWPPAATATVSMESALNAHNDVKQRSAPTCATLPTSHAHWPLKLHSPKTSDRCTAATERPLRFAISGRMADVCAEIERLAAIETS